MELQLELELEGGGSEVQDGEWCEHFIQSTIVQLVNETNEDVC